MKRYFIEEAKCGVSEGGMACGPVSGSVNASVKFRDGGKTFWLTNSEVTGIPNFFLTDKDVFDQLCNDDFSEEFNAYMQECFVSDFEGITLGEYEEVFESIMEDPENPAIQLVRYLIALTRCKIEEEEGLIELAVGKYIDEVDVPLTTDEEEWTEDMAEGEDE